MREMDIEQVLNDIREFRNDRKVLIYGAGGNSTQLFKRIKKEFGDIILGFVDIKVPSDFVWQNELGKIYPLEYILDKKEYYFIAVSVGKIDRSIKTFLNNAGYSDKDYSYHPEYYFERHIFSPQNYSDEVGNKIIGKLSDANVTFWGKNSVVKVGERVLADNLDIRIGSDVICEIGSGVEFGVESWHYGNGVKNVWVVSDKSFLSIQDGCMFFEGGLTTMDYHSSLVVGEKGYFRNEYRINVGKKAELKIGKGFMASYYTTIYTDDAHPIYDLKDGREINAYDPDTDALDIGDHVWLGLRSSIMGNGVKIGSGCVIGSHSLVRNKFPNNCILAGTPARIIRKDICWDNYHDTGFSDIPATYRKLTNDEMYNGGELND